ncbi:MAG TPA: DNA primase [Burkholderiales bacterium]|nr:DNA primase [Burkholderiales bacterium]
MIPQTFIQDLLNRVDIVDVVSRNLKLKKAGQDYTACCPFHNEKTPSFTVSPSKQFYHCFGCGAHGTAISFLMERENLSFRESVEMLANQAGMILPSEAAPAKKQSVELLEIMNKAAEFYRRQLKQSQAAISYLKSRGVTGDAAARFGLGFAPSAWQNLSVIFPDYQHPSLKEAGLVIENENKRYDRFRNRVMFPILNQRGAVIAFGGRVLSDEEPKYLNSPESPLFEKGRELYGLFQARRARNKTALVVVEGYMDVLMLAQHGIENVVATLGTATTAHHVEKLLRQTDALIFCFDGDAAGKRAAWRALEVALPQITDGKQVAFLFLPVGHDPDSFVRQFGRDRFESEMREALPLSEFLIRDLSSRVNLQSDEGRTALVHSAKPFIQSVKAPVYSRIVRERVAELAGLSRRELDADYQIKLRSKSAAVGDLPREIISLRRRLLRKLLKCLLAKPQLAIGLDSSLLRSPDCEADALLALLEFLRVCPQVKTTAEIVQNLSMSSHEPVLQELQVEMSEQLNEDFDVEQEFSAALAKLKEMQRRQEIEALRKKPEWSAEDKASYRRLVPVGKS